MIGRRSLLLFLGALLLAGCGSKQPVETAKPRFPAATVESMHAPAPQAPTALAGTKAVAHAKAYAVTGKLPAGARRDCSGFVVAAFRAAGAPMDIPPAYQKHKGVSAMLHAWSKAEKRVVGEPKAGDVVFFRDTYGKLLGRVTHVGIVEDVKTDGTVVVLHYMGGKIRRDLLNTKQPKDVEKNGWLRRKKTAGEPALAGELFVAYARF